MSTADLYEQDFYAWVERNATLIREGKWRSSTLSTSPMNWRS